MGRLRALECTIPSRINLKRVFYSSMVSPGTYANLLELYHCTVSVAIKELCSSSIFNLDRMALLLLLQSTGVFLLLLSSFFSLFFTFVFFFFLFYFRATRRTLHGFYEKAILLSGKRVSCSHARAIAHQSTGLLCVETYICVALICLRCPAAPKL